MTKNDFIIPAVFGLILAVIYLASLDWISPPSLTVQIYGKPVANASVMVFNSVNHRASTDASGSIQGADLGGKHVHVFFPEGKGLLIKCPEFGRKIVDFQGPKTITRTEVSYFGIFTSVEESTQYTYADEQFNAIQMKQMTLEEVEEQIDRAVEKRMYPAT